MGVCVKVYAEGVKVYGSRDGVKVNVYGSRDGVKVNVYGIELDMKVYGGRDGRESV